jgi:hypothetical protein
VVIAAHAMPALEACFRNLRREEENRFIAFLVEKDQIVYLSARSVRSPAIAFIEITAAGCSKYQARYQKNKRVEENFGPPAEKSLHYR